MTNIQLAIGTVLHLREWSVPLPSSGCRIRVLKTLTQVTYRCTDVYETAVSMADGIRAVSNLDRHEAKLHLKVETLY